jgi:hypothetical protein
MQSCVVVSFYSMMKGMATLGKERRRCKSGLVSSSGRNSGAYSNPSHLNPFIATILNIVRVNVDSCNVSRCCHNDNHRDDISEKEKE